jgi:hypothetical protein
MVRSIALGSARKTEKHAMRWADTRRMRSNTQPITTTATATNCSRQKGRKVQMQKQEIG